MERAFGIAEREADDKFRFYLCPYHHGRSRRTETYLYRPWREDLADYLREEDEYWVCYTRLRGIPSHGSLVNAETFQRMESVPSTAIGMWLFPPEAFEKPKEPASSNIFDLSGSRPGLLLVEL
jgi:hypothetical protein